MLQGYTVTDTLSSLRHETVSRINTPEQFHKDAGANPNALWNRVCVRNRFQNQFSGKRVYRHDADGWRVMNVACCAQASFFPV